MHFLPVLNRQDFRGCSVWNPWGPVWVATAACGAFGWGRLRRTGAAKDHGEIVRYGGHWQPLVGLSSLHSCELLGAIGLYVAKVNNFFQKDMEALIERVLTLEKRIEAVEGLPALQAGLVALQGRVVASKEEMVSSVAQQQAGMAELFNSELKNLKGDNSVRNT